MHRQRLRRLMDFMLFIRYPFVPVPKPTWSDCQCPSPRAGSGTRAAAALAGTGSIARDRTW